MTDFTSNPPHRRLTCQRRTIEFAVYFSLIFLLALIPSFIGWMRDVITHRSLNLLGPLARAWAEADRTTPLIFSV